ncbi:MAG TPA: CBS domain-containing protein [Oscillospiraceae bacterium]|nr:CBS domain-containing protein [Oscillospiraceae bacterium]
MSIKEIMTSEVIAVTQETTVDEAARLLLEHKISGLPVVDEQQQVVGMVTEADLIYQAKELHTPAFTEILGGVIFLEDPDNFKKQLQKMSGYRVADVMTTPVFTVAADASKEEVATMMVEQGINRVPVVGTDGRLQGIVSRQDLLSAMF